MGVARGGRGGRWEGKRVRETRTSLLDTSEMTWPINWAAILSVGPGQQGPASEARRLVEGRPAGAARRARGEARTVVSRFQALALGARFRTAWTRLSEIVVVQQRWRSASLAPAAGARTASTPDPLSRSCRRVVKEGLARNARRYARAVAVARGVKVEAPALLAHHCERTVRTVRVSVRFRWELLPLFCD